MAMDAFLQIPTLKGESQDKDLKGEQGWMVIESWSFGAHNNSNFSPTSGGGGKAKGELSHFNIMKSSEKASAQLLKNCLSGQHFAEASIMLRKATGDTGQMPFIEYKFKKVIVSSIQWSGANGGGDSVSESLTLAFDEVHVIYYEQDAAGSTKKSDAEAVWTISKAAPVTS